MKSNIKTLLIGSLMTISFAAVSQQANDIKLNPEKVKMFTPYLEWKHGGKGGFEAWKSTNKMQYAKEMWYYSESFYVKRDHLTEGAVLNEEIIDITRFENQRQKSVETIILMPGFKDAIVLLPENNLLYKL
jgi:hypothetical protein